MKFCSMNGPTESEVESLLMSPCWGPAQNGSQDQYLLDGHKLLLEHDLDSLPSDTEQKNSLDVLDNLLMNSSSLNALSDLKPLPPFTGYTGHLSINGISGHHYHAIAQRLPDESNNNYIQSAYHTGATTNPSSTGILGATTIQLAASSTGNSPNGGGGGGGGGGMSLSSSHNSSADHNIVSSSTCLPESVLSSDADACLNDVKLFADSQLDSKLYSLADSCVMSHPSNNSTTSAILNGGQDPDSGGVRIYADAKDLTEYVDMNSIDDIAAIIGSAIADTTVPNQMDKDDGNDTRDSWIDLDAWIEGNCIQQEGKLVVSQQDSLSEFILPQSPVHPSSSTLQSLLTHGYMPLLQNRLQNGPPSGNIKGEAPSSTSFCNELTTATSTSASPPGSVVSTTDNLMINPRYLTNPAQYQISMKSEGICSPDMMGNYPHTTTITPTGTPKTKRSRSQKKSSASTLASSSLGNGPQNGSQPQQMNSITSPSSVNFNANDLTGLLGKEKPVHRCSICNRGFLNKSNIKVHLRTHTGEKPFRCEVCAKAFRQKAHLLKHQQIHKRIGRD
ncbi:ichor [Lucilia sericata]|uniref:ichor n=1 Tax=Lucilia sericata TaxID=13632 RepID=UPI0018A7F3F7|nr:ichor [Lucilia sericata]XP_037814002.1 ichor [Lucilia sericata]XP_037814011.1 ichor [Lucilia sericata]